MKGIYKRKIIPLLLGISILSSVLCGCKTEAAKGEVSGGVYKDMAGDAPWEETISKPLPEVVVDEKDVFSLLSVGFEYTNSDWWYWFKFSINPDGTFTGEGTRGFKGESMDCHIECTGQFSEPVKLGNGIYGTKVESIQWGGEYREEKQENCGLYYTHYYLDYDEFMLQCSLEFLGLSEGDELEIYLPGAPLEETNEEFLKVLRKYKVSEKRRAIPRGYPGLYNVTENYVYTDKAGDYVEAGGRRTYGSGDEDGTAVLMSVGLRNIKVLLYSQEDRGAYEKSYIENISNNGIADCHVGYTLMGDVDEDDQTDFYLDKLPDYSRIDSPEGPCRLHLEYLDDAQKTVRITLICEDGGDLSSWGGTEDGTFTAELSADAEKIKSLRIPFF